VLSIDREELPGATDREEPLKRSTGAGSLDRESNSSLSGL